MKKLLIILMFILASLSVSAEGTLPLQYYTNGEVQTKFMHTNTTENVKNELKVVTFESGVLRIESETIDLDLDKVGRKRMIYFLKSAIGSFELDHKLKFRKDIGRVVGNSGFVSINLTFSYTPVGSSLVLNLFDYGGSNIRTEIITLDLEQTKKLMELINKTDEIMVEHRRAMDEIRKK